MAASNGDQLQDRLYDARKRGLPFRPCPICRRTGQYIGADGLPYTCKSCGGPGYDTTPWSIVGAVRGTGAVLVSQNHLSYTPNQMRHQWEATVKHTGTDEAIAEAALTAWLQVVQARDVYS